ncbi:hypothetical protein [Xanthobacter autotrophicus]|uniref:hypothetical protein n=1 Tax=Xanthobacter autotrophicus TaxID=280 RepID=UPI003729D1D1
MKKQTSGNPNLKAGPGRPKGKPNRTTTMLKDAILQAAENVGQDGAGKGGTTGYLQRLALEEPKAFATLLGRVLPLQVTGEGGGPVKFTIVSGVPRAGD